MNKSKWIKGNTTRKLKIYYMVNELYDKYKNDKDNPDYIKGIEYEPYMMYIFSSGFKDLYHVVIENGEGLDTDYHFLQSLEIQEKFKIDINE